MRSTLLTLVLALAATVVVPSAAEAQTSQAREGFWLTVGLGVGSAGCDGCTDRDTGLTGSLALGGTLSDQWLLGVATNNWVWEDDMSSVSLGTLTALVRFYPSETGGLFLQGALGFGTVSAEHYGFGRVDEVGGGALLGLGYDIRIASNVSLSPYLNGVGVSVDGGDFNFTQLGLNLTIH